MRLTENVSLLGRRQFKVHFFSARHRLCETIPGCCDKQQDKKQDKNVTVAKKIRLEVESIDAL